MSTTPKSPKLPVPIATDSALHVIAKDGRDVPLSYWDLWYVLLAEDAYDGELNKLGYELREMRKHGSGSDDAEGKLSHLRDLQRRLTDADLSLNDVLPLIPPELAKAEGRRAHGRIIKHNQRSYELSEPMLNLPEERLYGIALRGMWMQFPVSPKLYYEKLCAKFNWRRYHEEDDSHGLAKKLDAETARAEKLKDKGQWAEALAILRSVLTVAIELTDVADDSFGYIGMSFEYAFEKYLAFSREKTGIPANAFLSDLLELLIFEEEGFTYDNTEGYFSTLSGEEADFCLGYLRDRIAALLALDLDRHADNALTLIGQITAEQRCFDLFESLAAEMGTLSWLRIIRLADAAVKSSKSELADRTFQAALSCEDGGHHDFLSKKHAQLLKGDWNADPKK